MLKPTFAFLCVLPLALLGGSPGSAIQVSEASGIDSPTHRVLSTRALPLASRRAPVLGADLIYADAPPVLIDGWQDPQRGRAMTEAFKSAGIRTLRFSSHGFYSSVSPEAAAAVKRENKLRNEFPWFAIDDFIGYLVTTDFSVVVGVNVEEGPEVAARMVGKFIAHGLASRIVAVELSNEPHLNHRPWMPEEYADSAVAVIERLTSTNVRFALPLTVGKDKNTPTKLSDDEWNSRMLRRLSTRVDLKSRRDIFGVLHLYGRGVSADAIKTFNRAVQPFAPALRYVVTEFNIRLGLEGNPHLTNDYAIEFARRLAEVMARPEVEAMYVHGVPYHSVLYWANGRRLATVVGQRDARLGEQELRRGWHLTPAGRVYNLYSEIAWNGELVEYRESGKRSHWAVRADDGRLVITLLNADSKVRKDKVRIAGNEMTIMVPKRSITCFEANGQQIAQVLLP